MFHKMKHNLTATLLDVVAMNRGGDAGLVSEALKSSCLSGSILAR